MPSQPRDLPDLSLEAPVRACRRSDTVPEPMVRSASEVLRACLCLCKLATSTDIPVIAGNQPHVSRKGYSRLVSDQLGTALVTTHVTLESASCALQAQDHALRHLCLTTERVLDHPRKGQMVPDRDSGATKT